MPSTHRRYFPYSLEVFVCYGGLARVWQKNPEVATLTKGETCLSDHLIEDSKLLLARLSSYSVQDVKREDNQAAHCLAKEAASKMLDAVWEEKCHLFLHNIVFAWQTFVA
jgi:hypothetical protein